MYGRKVKLRFFFILLIITTLALSVFLLVKSLEENVIFFKSPTEIKTLSEIGKKKIRIGGMVKKDSITMISKEIKFIVDEIPCVGVSQINFYKWIILKSLRI